MTATAAPAPSTPRSHRPTGPALAFLGGVVSVQTLPTLPAPSLVVGLAALILLLWLTQWIPGAPCERFLLWVNANFRLAMAARRRVSDATVQVVRRGVSKAANNAGALIWNGNRGRPALRLLLWLTAGAVYALLRSGIFPISPGLAPPGPAAWEGHTLRVIGSVATEPRHESGTERFEFTPEEQGLEGGGRLPPRLRLSYRVDPEDPRPHLGERWSLDVSLRPPLGMMNPGAFDYERWLFAHRIGALGRVIQDPHAPTPIPTAAATPPNHRLADALGPAPWLSRLRHRLATDTFTRIKPPVPSAPIQMALTLGLEGGIPQSAWTVFRKTGTSHLVAISGMHITLIAALAFFLTRRLWGVLPTPLRRLQSPRLAALVAMATAFGYALLAGWSVPTQRSAVMVSMGLLGILLGRRRPMTDHLAWALLAVLIYDPLAVLDVGFWLSFGAVTIILYGYAGRPPGPLLWWQFGRIHLLMAVGLAPLLLYLFGQQPNVGPLANLVAVPWVSFVVVPLAFLAVLLTPGSATLGQFAVEAADLAFTPLWIYLEWLAGLEGAVWRTSLDSPWPLVAALAGAALLFLPRGLPGRWLFAIFFLPLLTATPERPPAGAAWLTVLDVGQGLAVVAETATHTLIFDTGPRLGEDADAGGMVIAPYLSHQGIRVVDQLIVSHSDSDHAGGLPGLMAAVPITASLTGAPLKVTPPQATPCRAGQHWAWDGVRFTILHPQALDEGKGNNLSCVLRIDTAHGSALVPGDIETPTERLLVRRYGAALKADVLLAAHHGSQSSSRPEFLAAVAPRHVVYSVGYHNRYHHPHPTVVERIKASGAATYATYRTGALRFTLGLPLPAPSKSGRDAGRLRADHPDDQAVPPPRAYRAEIRRYYHWVLPEADEP